MSHKNRRWTNILINPKYQFKYIFWMTSSGLALVCLYSVIVYLYMSENYKILVELSPMEDSAKAQLYRELNQLLLILGGISFVFLGLVSLLGLLISHRTAGPLYHFKRVFLDVAQGKTHARVHLRPTDDFQDVAQTFNTMLDTLTKSAPGSGSLDSKKTPS